MLPSLWVTAIIPVAFPAAVGENVTEIWQLLPIANEVPQVLVCANTEAVMPVMARGAFPLLVSVAVCAVLVVPTVCKANVSAVGLRCSSGSNCRACQFYRLRTARLRSANRNAGHPRS